MRVLVADKLEEEGVKGLEQAGAEVRVGPDLEGETLKREVESFDPHVIVVRSTKVPASVIAAGRDLKGIVRAGAGYDNIDVEAASAKRVAVCNCPGMNAVAVAELAMGLLIACDRRLPDQTVSAREGQWNKQEFSKARGLKGRTLVLIGMGNIGRAVVQRAKAFEMNVIVWSRSLTPERAKDLGVVFGGTTREDLLLLAERADAVSIHVAANAETEKLIDKAFFDRMKPHSILINTSRGSVVDEEAMGEAVHAKGVRVGLDVYRDQPSQKTGVFASATATLPGAYFSHHVGASTDQAQLAVAEEVVRIVETWDKTGRFENCVNARDIL